MNFKKCDLAGIKDYLLKVNWEGIAKMNDVNEIETKNRFDNSKPRLH